ncbi:MAG: ATP-dependent RecD-like DNA helicase [Clostridia bacterium]|nr:ATP-dependent RecD-like DNA helicase [Clostridia bacterium]
MKENQALKNERFITGTVQKITYKNSQNGYTVAVIRVGRENVTAVGTMPFLCEGESADFEGGFVVHPTYGTQFAVTGYDRKTPETSAAILKYLSSGAIKGIGQSTAIKIVEKFGVNSLRIIEDNPGELASIRGISAEKAAAISEEFKNQSALKSINLLLAPYGVTPEQCVRIYKTLGAGCADIIKDNPYILCKYDLDVSFELTERIALDYGISADNDKRIAAGIGYILRQNLSNGHTALPQSKLFPVAQRLLECDIMRIECVCEKMIAAFELSKKVIGEETFVSIPEYYSAEEYIAARIKALVSRPSGDAIDELEIDYVQNKRGIKFAENQRRAIKLAFGENMMILTGGPGTGKTTALCGIIDLFERRGALVTLAAPTGRAAKRITELTGREAKTVHRLLEAEWVDGKKTRFARNERNPLLCDVLIVDEASMLDSLLFEALIRSVKLGCKMILVGDTDQLPGISAGNVLADLLQSGKVASVALNEVFRQSKESLIVNNAHAIINNLKPDISNNGGDFFFFERQGTDAVVDTVLELCSNRLPAAYGFDPVKDIQVLCPSRKLGAGSFNLNNLLQQRLNVNAKDTAHLSYKGVYYCKGDKVMQIKNNYDLPWEKENGESGFGVFNGDIGVITDINVAASSMRILYDDKYVLYYADNFSEIELAYAVTVHKSQGSEFDCVILPLSGIPSPLAYRNLLYTAITRAKKLFIGVGSKELLFKMCDNNKKTLRYTLLKEFLSE